MQKSKLVLLLIAAVSTSLVLSAIAITSTSYTYTWEKTFEVTKPKVECQIKIGEPRIVGCPVKIWVWLKLNCKCYWEKFSEDCWKENCDEWETNCLNCVGCLCSVNGTYEAHLYWYNVTSESWQHLMYLQEPINMTITCQKHIETYTFTPVWEGQYKVVVNFTVDTEVSTFEGE